MGRTRVLTWRGNKITEEMTEALHLKHSAITYLPLKPPLNTSWYSNYNRSFCPISSQCRNLFFGSQDRTYPSPQWRELTVISKLPSLLCSRNNYPKILNCAELQCAWSHSQPYAPPPMSSGAMKNKSLPSTLGYYHSSQSKQNGRQSGKWSTIYLTIKKNFQLSRLDPQTCFKRVDLHLHGSCSF